MRKHVIVSFPVPFWVPVPDGELFQSPNGDRPNLTLWFQSREGSHLVTFDQDRPPFQDSSGQRLELTVQTPKGLQYVAYEVHASSDSQPDEPDRGYRYPIRQSWAYVLWGATEEEERFQGDGESPAARFAFEEVKRFVEWYKGTANSYQPKMFRWVDVPYAWLYWPETVSIDNGTIRAPGGSRELWLDIAWEAKTRNLTVDLNSDGLNRLKQNYATGRSVDLIGQKLLLVKELLYHYGEYSLAVLEAASAFELYLKKCIRIAATRRKIATLKHNKKMLPVDFVLERSLLQQDIDYLKEVSGVDFRKNSQFPAWDNVRELRNSIAHRGGTVDKTAAWDACGTISDTIYALQRDLDQRFTS